MFILMMKQDVTGKDDMKSKTSRQHLPPRATSLQPAHLSPPNHHTINSIYTNHISETKKWLKNGVVQHPQTLCQKYSNPVK